MFDQVSQLLWDQPLASPDKQEELVKLGTIEVAAKHLPGPITTAAPLTGKERLMVHGFYTDTGTYDRMKHCEPNAGLLSTLAASCSAARDAILACRPSILPLFTATLPITSPSCAAAIIGAIRSSLGCYGICAPQHRKAPALLSSLGFHLPDSPQHRKFVKSVAVQAR